jgi:hypothetical protein
MKTYYKEEEKLIKRTITMYVCDECEKEFTDYSVALRHEINTHLCNKKNFDAILNTTVSMYEIQTEQQFQDICRIERLGPHVKNVFKGEGTYILCSFKKVLKPIKEFVELFYNELNTYIKTLIDAANVETFIIPKVVHNNTEEYTDWTPFIEEVSNEDGVD